MRISGIIKLLLIVLFVITLTACSKTKPDNNLERLWESLIARNESFSGDSIATCGAEADFVSRGSATNLAA